MQHSDKSPVATAASMRCLHCLPCMKWQQQQHRRCLAAKQASPAHATLQSPPALPPLPTCGPRNMPKGTPPYFSLWCSWWATCEDEA